jgi:hypothetical protein
MARFFYGDRHMVRCFDIDINLQYQCFFLGRSFVFLMFVDYCLKMFEETWLIYKTMMNDFRLASRLRFSCRTWYLSRPCRFQCESRMVARWYLPHIFICPDCEGFLICLSILRLLCIQCIYFKLVAGAITLITYSTGCYRTTLSICLQIWGSPSLWYISWLPTGISGNDFQRDGVT